MNRRQFAAALASLVAVPGSGPRIFLEAVAAPRMPHWLSVEEAAIAAHGAHFFELRVYDSPGLSEFGAILHRAGIHPVPRGHGAYLIPFDSLAARQNAWTRFDSDPEWREGRNRAGVLNRVAIYKRVRS